MNDLPANHKVASLALLVSVLLALAACLPDVEADVRKLLAKGAMVGLLITPVILAGGGELLMQWGRGIKLRMKAGGQSRPTEHDESGKGNRTEKGSKR